MNTNDAPQKSMSLTTVDMERVLANIKDPNVCLVVTLCMSTGKRASVVCPQIQGAHRPRPGSGGFKD
jgi:uncharacterized protein